MTRFKVLWNTNSSFGNVWGGQTREYEILFMKFITQEKYIFIRKLIEISVYRCGWKHGIPFSGEWKEDWIRRQFMWLLIFLQSLESKPTCDWIFFWKQPKFIQFCVSYSSQDNWETSWLRRQFMWLPFL